MIKLYIQNKDYKTEGLLSGLLIDHKKHRIALFGSEGTIEEVKVPNHVKWMDIDLFENKGNIIKVRTTNHGVRKEFECYASKRMG